MLVVGAFRISYGNGKFMWLWNLAITRGFPRPAVVDLVVVILTTAPAQQNLVGTSSAPPRTTPTQPVIANKLTPLNIFRCCHHLLVATITVKVVSSLAAIFSLFPFGVVLPPPPHLGLIVSLLNPSNLGTITIIITRSVIGIIKKRLPYPNSNLHVFSNWKRKVKREDPASPSPAAELSLGFKQTLSCETIMALFGMAWLLKMRSEIRSSGNKVLSSRQISQNIFNACA